MSDNSHDDAHHTGPIKTPKQLLVTVFISFVAPVFIIIGLVYYVTSAFKPDAGVIDTEKQIASRIQKVGLVEIRDANRTLKSGEEVFKAQCTTCHTAGVAGAPKFGDATAWGPRIKQGLEALVTSAMKGKGAMGAQGGGDFEDLEISRAVVYMANSGGAKFAEPKGAAPAVADAAAEATGTTTAAADATATSDGASVKVDGNVVKFYFASGNAVLANGAKEALADIVKGVQAGKKVLVSGFHDASGDKAKNAELAKQRALAVRDALQAAGIAQDKVDLKKPEQLTGSGKSDEARRVEVTLI